MELSLDAVYPTDFNQFALTFSGTLRLMIFSKKVLSLFGATTLGKFAIAHSNSNI